MATRTARGAITAENTIESILENTKIMLTEILEKNNIDINGITSILFTCTKDLDKVYPAVAARELGITGASLMCMQELYVEKSLAYCIRAMVSFDSEDKQSEILHVYLKGASNLRLDLKKEQRL